MRALITRPRAEAEELAAALELRGIGAVIEPLMRVRYRAGPPPDLAGAQAVLCTSANGVRALARATGERAIPLLAVGDATARRALAEGFAAVASAAGTVADLARLASSQLRPEAGRVIHVAADSVAGDLTGQLRRSGFAVERLVLYEARPSSALGHAAIEALRSGEIDLALFFSPRTAAIFVRLAGQAGLAREFETVTALSISAAADAALAALRWRGRRIAERPDRPALLVELDRMLAERG